MSALKKTSFTLQYTNSVTGERCSERPRLMISIDGSQKSLVVGDGIIIASGDINISESELWDRARSAIYKI